MVLSPCGEKKNFNFFFGKFFSTFFFLGKAAAGRKHAAFKPALVRGFQKMRNADSAMKVAAEQPLRRHHPFFTSDLR